jgi:imidazole glycerol-phosphate synthase subunit HisH
MIALIDYGGGNIGSVKNALDKLKIQSIITNEKEEIVKAEKIILPGQGRFGDVMNKLKGKGLEKVLTEEINKGKPYLGICIGLQILFEKGEEDPEIKGLGLLKGDVPKFNSGQKIPQIGWNNVNILTNSILFKGIPNGTFFYFVHSYYACPENEKTKLCKTTYGIEFASGIENSNVFAVQFHPEKSGVAGLKLLKNFCEMV